ncbi:hypothetical protein lerEdw1_020874 [Lerista edwardsae]|nr:hypothetical protein lerEdw1_020874 [Lerista edwardsae]
MGPMVYVTLGLLGCLAASPFLAAAMPGADLNLCLEGWFFMEGSCYRYFPEKVCWREAEEACQTLGAHLASIRSKKECCRLRTYLSRFRPNGDIWVGLHNPLKDPGTTSWEWSDGLPFDHSQWSKGQPNNYGEVGEFCAELWKSTGFRRWNDESCHRKNSFVCKYLAQPEDAACE